MDPRLSKKFVSPLLNRPSASTSTTTTHRSPYFTPSRPSRLSGPTRDFVPDSDDDDDDRAGGMVGVGSSGRPRPEEFEDMSVMDEPVARVVRKGGNPLLPGAGAGSSSSRGRENNLPQPAQRSTNSNPNVNEPESYWMVQYRKPQAKKHKTWDGDAVLVVRGSRCYMKDLDGRDIASAAYTAGRLGEGMELRVGGREVEVDHEIPAQEYLDGTCFGYNPLPTANAPTPTRQPSTVAKSTANNNALLRPPNAGPYKPALPFKPVPQDKFFADPRKAPAPGLVKRVKVGEPKFDPNAEGAVVMKRPSKDHAAKHNRKNLDIVDVVVDPGLSQLLRPHQKEGIKFMYECVMGMRRMEGTGCILADEMGLGKTLQTIALILTLLQQTPYGGPSAGGVVGKVLIVSPVSLVQNWRKEFHKWLGKHRVGVFVGDGDKQKIRQFASSKSHQVLLIGYEKLRTVIDYIKTCSPPIGLVICDEGHRLKSKDNKTTKMFDVLSTKRRIILSGTPLQNHLQEYWSMADFACPGLLDTYSAFSKIYEKPIMKSRAPKCSAKDLELGKARADKLNEITREFVLRRTADILSNYLPPKHEYVVYIAPTALQIEVLQKILSPRLLQALTRGATAQCLALITILKKVCNSPLLLRGKDDVQKEVEADLQAAMDLVPHSARLNDPSYSGKMIALDKLLGDIYHSTDEKLVLVSNYTSTLDMLEALCNTRRYKCLRLDGSTQQKTRQDLVDSFNRDGQSQSFVFLLSSKAGGVGLNLIGASRLVLFDSDWNPSTDLQAQARIHRDGQKRPVHIYRFLTTGTIEEKIYQRQVTKIGLSDQLIDQAGSSKGESDAFSAAELKDLFTITTKTNGCQTHDLLECDCLIDQIKAQQSGDVSLVNSVNGDGDVGDDSNEELPGLDQAGGGGAVDGVEDSDEEERATFMMASQYDGKPSKKQQARTAKEKQAKLAALHKWTHIDPKEPASLELLRDELLAGIIASSGKKSTSKRARKKKKDEFEPTKVTSNLEKFAFGRKGMKDAFERGDEVVDNGDVGDVAGAEGKGKETDETMDPDLDAVQGNDDSLSNMFDDSMDSVGRDDKTKRKAPRSSPEWPSDNEDDVNDKSNDNNADRNEANGFSDDSDDEQPVTKKRKTTTTTTIPTTNNTQQPVKSTADWYEEEYVGLDVGVTGKKYDLKEMAEAGQGGNIMFIFEKVSGSKL